MQIYKNIDSGDKSSKEYITAMWQRFSLGQLQGTITAFYCSPTSVS